MRRPTARFSWPTDQVPTRKPGRRCLAMLSVTTGLLTGQSIVAGDEVPDLAPPLDAPAVAPLPRLINPTRLPLIATPTVVPTPNGVVEPPVAGRASAPPTIVSTPRAVLAIPRVSGPISALPAMPPITPDEPASAKPVPESTELLDEPMLDAPVGMPETGTGIASDRLAPLREASPPSSADIAPIPGPVPSSPTQLSPPTTRRIEPAAPTVRGGARITPTPATRRRFFGLFPAPALAIPTPSRPRPGASINASDDPHQAIDHLTPEAIAEARLKQRIEKQARDLIGDRARTIEVHVQGKSASVQARGVKFYQKRTVRRSLESIPALSGLRSKIDVLD